MRWRAPTALSVFADYRGSAGDFDFLDDNATPHNPEDDEDLFYDLYDGDGICLNLGEPWMDEGAGPPNFEEVSLSFG